MTLLIDLGNSRMKSALARGNGLFYQAPVDLSAPDWAQVAQARWQSVIDPEATSPAMISCVTAQDRLQAVQSVLESLRLASVVVGPPASDDLLALAYRDAGQLGVDRWLAMRAARRRCATPLVLASAGSALTIDVIDGTGRHLGGVIAPSPPRALEALRARAAHLDTAGQQISEFADNTADATWSGAWLAAAALIERVHRRTSIRLGTAPALWLSGGDAEQIAPLLDPPARIEHDLVLRGLADMAEASLHA